MIENLGSEKESARNKVNRNWRIISHELRKKVLMFLGGKCKRCGFEDVRALQIDHVNGGGAKEIRRLGATSMYRRVFRHPEEYQLLCANCNWIKREERGERIFPSKDKDVDPEHLRYVEQLDPETKKYTGRFINEKHGWAWEWVVDCESKIKEKYYFKIGHYNEGKFLRLVNMIKD